jgi:CheY-like chemotaxis protein
MSRLARQQPDVIISDIRMPAPAAWTCWHGFANSTHGCR